MEKKEEYDFYSLGMKYSLEQHEKVEDMIEDYRLNYGGEAAQQFALGVTKGLEVFKSLVSSTSKNQAYDDEPEDASELFDNARDDLRNYR